jgi:hypothetical protein
MTGTGLSVFKGTKIEEFQIEVLGVMPKSYAGHDMILVRCSGANLEHTGVIAGMSGSPVYIDGKLIGAVAMTYGFQKDPIAEVTPIGVMTDIMTRTDMPDEGLLPRTNDECQMTNGIGNWASSTTCADHSSVISNFQFPISNFQLPVSAPPTAANNDLALHPIPCPLAVSGLDSRTCAVFVPQFEKLGLNLMPGSGEAGSSEVSDTTDLQPGAAVGVGLIRGDMNAAAIGTLTYREGNRIVAFGHPMDLGGAVQMPMIGGIIHTIVASTDLSFKMFSPTAPIGAITQDRANGVAGTIGEKVPMIPVNVAVRSSGQDHQYHYEVVNQRSLTPSLAGMTVASALTSREQAANPLTAQMDISIRLHGYPVIRNHRWFSGDGAAREMPGEVSDALQYLTANPYEKIAVDSIGVGIDVTPGTNLLDIIRVVADRERVKPGEDVHLAVTLLPFRGPARTEDVDLTIPRETPDGPLQLLVTTPDTALIASIEAAGPQGQPRSLQQMIKLVQRIGNENQLVVQAYLKQRGMYVDGEEYPNLPPSMLSVMNDGRATGTKGQTDVSLLFEKRIPQDEIVTGSQMVTVTVER